MVSLKEEFRNIFYMIHKSTSNAILVIGNVLIVF